QILGMRAEQIIDRTLSNPMWQSIREDGSPFPADEHPAILTLQTGRCCRNVTMGLRQPDGTITWICINSDPLQCSGEPRPHSVVTTFSDVTRQRQAELILKHSEGLYRSLVENQGE